MTSSSFRGAAAGVAASLVLASCSYPNATIPVGTFNDADSAHYLILSEQLRWRRDLEESRISRGGEAGKVLKVCVGVLPNGWRGGWSTVDAAIVERLHNDSAKEEIKIDVVSSWECLAHYTTDEEPVGAEASDNLAYAGYDPGGKCGDWIGGTWDGLHGRDREYRIEVDDGVVELGGGRGCAAYGRWVRT
jgi:hypothetical protein